MERLTAEEAVAVLPRQQEISLAVLATVIGGLVTRMAVYHLKVKSPMD